MRQGFPLQGSGYRVLPVASSRAEVAGVLDIVDLAESPAVNQYAAAVAASGPRPPAAAANPQPALPFTREYLMAAGVIPVGTPAAGNATVLTDADSVSGFYFPPPEPWGRANFPVRAQRVLVVVVFQIAGRTAATLGPAFAGQLAALHALGVHVHVTSACRRVWKNPLSGPVLVGGASTAIRHPNVGGSTSLDLYGATVTGLPVARMPPIGDVYWAHVGGPKNTLSTTDILAHQLHPRGYCVQATQSGLAGALAYTPVSIPGFTSLGYSTGTDGLFDHINETFIDGQKAAADLALLDPYATAARRFRFAAWNEPDPQDLGAGLGYSVPAPGTAATVKAVVAPDRDWFAFKTTSVRTSAYDPASSDPANTTTIAAEIVADALAFFAA